MLLVSLGFCPKPHLWGYMTRAGEMPTISPRPEPELEFTAFIYSVTSSAVVGVKTIFGPEGFFYF